MSHFIDARNITFSYSRKQSVLHGLNFSAEKGERVALTGPSGCGKSTFGYILAGHLSPRPGRVLIDGQDRTGWPSREVFVVHQEGDLFPWLKARDQIVMALADGEARAHADELLELMRLGQFANFYPHQLSGGMKKRLAIARAFALKPKLMILDESFASLDQPLRISLFQELKELGRKMQTTMVMITHDARDIELFEAREFKLTPS